MVISIKNKKLHKEIFKKMNAYDDKAEKYYAKGQRARGRIYEAKSDKLYKDNYNKIFKITRRSK